MACAGWDHDQHFVISHDFFTTQHQKVVSCGNQFEIVGNKVSYLPPSIKKTVLLSPQISAGGTYMGFHH